MVEISSLEYAFSKLNFKRAEEKTKREKGNTLYKCYYVVDNYTPFGNIPAVKTFIANGNNYYKIAHDMGIQITCKIQIN